MAVFGQNLHTPIILQPLLYDAPAFYHTPYNKVNPIRIDPFEFVVVWPWYQFHKAWLHQQLDGKREDDIDFYSVPFVSASKL